MVSSVKKVTFPLLLMCLWTFKGICAASYNITITPESSGEVLTVCPGDFISITCSHNETSTGRVTRWLLPVHGSCNVIHGDQAPICSPFSVTMISDASEAAVTSTVQTTATEALNDSLVECSGGLPPNVVLVGSVNISVLSIPTPSLPLLSQVSQSMVEVDLMVDDLRCAATFVANATQDGGSQTFSVSNSTSLVSIGDLDVCRYNYSFVGNVVTSGGEAGEMSPVASFTADLTVLNGINVTVNQVDPLIEWVQMDNPLYPTCITGYEIRDETNGTLVLTVDNSTRSVTGQQLNEVGFPYCTSIQPTVRPITPIRPLGAVPGGNANSTDLIDPNFPSPMLSETYTLVNRSENSTGFIILRANVQRVSLSVVPTRNYQYTTNGTESQSMRFTSDYFEIVLPEAAAGQEVLINVTFQNGPCSNMSSTTYDVPRLEITNLTQDEPTDTSQTITITLPLTEYQPEQLLIISTASAPGENDTTVVANFTSPSMQYTVTFTGLTETTAYSFTISIVLRNSTEVEVQAVDGTFTTMMTPTTLPPTTMEVETTTPTSTTTMGPTGSAPTPAPQTCDIGCIVGVIVAAVAVIALVIIIIIVIFCIYRSAHTKTVKITAHEMGEPTHKLTATNGEEPDPVKNEEPTSLTFTTPPPEGTDAGATGSGGAPSGDKENLIYADLDLAKGTKKPVKAQVSGPSETETGKDEEVHYATIDVGKKAPEPPTEEAAP